jgi:hypothetical protein
VWKIRLGIVMAAVDVALLAWLVGEHLSGWLTTALMSQ